MVSSSLPEIVIEFVCWKRSIRQSLTIDLNDTIHHRVGKTFPRITLDTLADRHVSQSILVD